MSNLIKRIFNKIKSINTKNIYVFFIALFFLLPLIGKLLPLKTNSIFQILGNNQENVTPKFSLKSFNNKSFQNQFEQNLGYSLNWTNLYIKNFNTVMFYLFNKSYSDDSCTIIGKNRYIFSTHYLMFYTSDLRYKPIQTKEMEQTINDFKLFQEYLKRKNKLLILTVTPNKVAFYNKYLPERYKVNRKYQRTDKDYYIFIKALKNSGLNYVNTRDYLKQIKGNIFEQDDVTWSLPTAFIVTQKLIDKINNLTEDKIEPLRLKKVISRNEANPDSLPVELLNIFFLPKEYKYQEVIPIRNVNASSKKLAIVGGCFTDKVIPMLVSANAFNHIENYNADSIRTINHIKYKVYQSDNSKQTKITDLNHLMQNILKNDIIIVDFNESFLIHIYLKDYLPEMKKYIKEHP